ncbi:Glutaredoxin [Macleaya cordata]|uniref:Glutaredoxin n=1 Tax=Macleaya cordata TaxID=56857 RepID=A0A200Q2N3_MACCD|nr:Glutaredoxin [Macleaya cordata]
MGCVSSSLLDQDDEFTQIGGSTGIGHHFVSLTSTTYGLLTIDPPHTDHNPPTPPRFGIVSLFPSPLSEPKSLRSEPEVINSWELMAGLDSESSRFSPNNSQPKPSFSLLHTVAELDSRISRSPRLFINKENSNPNRQFLTGTAITDHTNVLKPLNGNAPRNSSVKYSLDQFEIKCPPGGENRVVIYTTTLRGVRKTFEACNAVRSAIEGFGMVMSERDVSMDRGFREELKDLMKGKENGSLIPPRVFIKGRYIGGYEEVLRIHEEGCLGLLLEGLPKTKVGVVCDGCGGVRFLPCFSCNGSCKIVRVMKEKEGKKVVIRCPDCNENGLVLCPICS